MHVRHKLGNANFFTLPAKDQYETETRSWVVACHFKLRIEQKHFKQLLIFSGHLHDDSSLDSFILRDSQPLQPVSFILKNGSQFLDYTMLIVEIPLFKLCYTVILLSFKGFWKLYGKGCPAPSHLVSACISVISNHIVQKCGLFIQNIIT